MEKTIVHKVVGKTSKIVVRISDKEKEMVDKILSLSGSNVSEFIRELIRDRYFKMFPSYREMKVKSIKEPALTEAQMCEAMGGKLVKENGITVCRIATVNKFSSFSRDLPLADVKREYKRK